MKKFLIVVLGVVLVSSCLHDPRSSSESALIEWVRSSDSAQPVGLQIYGLRNPVVTELVAEALRQERRGLYEQAAGLLEEALLIEPNAPDLLQHLAEVRLEQERWAEARSLISRSIELGPRLGHLCQRNYRGLSVAYQRLGQSSDAAKALARVPLCERSRPERF